MKTTLSICVVDDEGSNLAMMSMMLRSMGFVKIDEFNNAPDALTFLQNNHTDLVVSDWNMDPMSGLDLLKAIRAGDRTHDTPFIMVTANTSEDYWKTAIAAGAWEFLFKPFSISAFRGAVYTCLGLDSRPAKPASPDSRMIRANALPAA